MPGQTSNLLFRNDTVLGVCEAIGNDFGFHPNWLRLTLASLFYFFPAAVVGTYVGLGLIVALTRWIAPDAMETATPALAVVDPVRQQAEAELMVLAA